MEILSKVCDVCKQNNTNGDQVAFKEWRAAHVANGACQKNYEGSSPNMETEAAHRMWSRSITLHKLR